MSAAINKRRRGGDDERRPKKKIRVKQKAYHSSSEDESDADAERAYDAPKEKPSDHKTVVLPKSILKRPLPASEAARPSIEPVEGQDDVEHGDVHINTALNAAKPADGDPENIIEENESDNEDNHDQSPQSPNDTSDTDTASDTQSQSSNTTATSSLSGTKKKRHDPSTFATSISRILSSKLTTSQRADPVLARSRTAAATHKAVADERLEHRVRTQLRAEKKAARDIGRVTDVLGLESGAADTGRIVEEERRLRRTAQRGVVRLFNAVRAAQVRGEEAMRQARAEGVVGMRQREERVNEMSKQGFLDLISRGGVSGKDGASVTAA